MSSTYLPPEGRYYDVGPVKIHMLNFGEGPDVVFVHGSGPGAGAWANFSGNYQAFVEAGFRVWLPDLVGFGHSDKPVDQGDYTLQFFVDTLKSALDAAGVKKCSMVGNSLGGGIAIQTALDDPAFVEKLILMGPGCLEDQPDYFKMPGIAKMMQAMGDGLTRDNFPAVLRNFVVDKNLITDDFVELRWSIAKDQPKEVLTTMKTPTLGPRMQELKQPVLTFWGADDEFMPPQGKETCLRANDQSRLIVVNACGHWVMMEHERMFNAASIDFLKHS